MVWRGLIRPVVFKTTDPEEAHRRSLDLLARFATQPGAGALRRMFCLDDPRLAVELWGLRFANPVGVAAGFDKNATAVTTWEHLGFGLVEVGTVTRHAQEGNPRPRLFRLTEDEAVINRLGFNNMGADRMAEQLGCCKVGIPVGINLGKSKITPLEEASVDYLYSFQKLYAYGDYFVVNVSSPNTPGLRELQRSKPLAEILASLQAANSRNKPLLVKIAPDLDWQEVDTVLEMAMRYRLAGVIATNTTIGREGLISTHRHEAGGLSGAPLRERSTEVVAYIYRETAGRLPIIGVGGIFDAEDAWAKITSGASLVQVYTGWVYEGPWMVRRILEGLGRKLDDHGFSTIAQAVGCGL